MLFTQLSITDASETAPGTLYIRITAKSISLLPRKIKSGENMSFHVALLDSGENYAKN